MDLNIHPGDDLNSSLFYLTSDGYYAAHGLRSGHFGGAAMHNLKLPKSGREAIGREIMKERIREEILAREMVERRILEEEVRRELEIERIMEIRRLQMERWPEFGGTSGMVMHGDRQAQTFMPSRIEAGITASHGRGTVQDVAELAFRERSSPHLTQKKTIAVVAQSALRHESEKVAPSNEKTISNCKVSGAKRKAQDELLIPAEKVWGCALCEVTVSSEESLKVHRHGKKHKAKEALLSSNKKNGLPQNELLIPADKEVLSCSLCEVSANSEEVLKEHLQGKKHKSKEALLNLNKKTAVSTPSAGASGSGSAKKKQQKLWCSLCKVKCNSAIMMEYHFAGKKHRNFMELKKVNNGAKAEAVNTVANERLGNTESTGVMKEGLETAHQSPAP